MSAITGLGLEWKQETRIPSRVSRTQALDVFCCFFSWLGRELDQEWNNQNSTWCSDLGCCCYKQQLTSLRHDTGSGSNPRTLFKISIYSCLFEREREKLRRTEIPSVHWFTPQMLATVGTRTGWSQQLRTRFKSPVWVAKTKYLSCPFRERISGKRGQKQHRDLNTGSLWRM